VLNVALPSVAGQSQRVNGRANQSLKPTDYRAAIWAIRSVR